MAGLPEGSVDRPYVENPNEHLKEVHWGGGAFAVAVHIEDVSEGTATAVFLHGSKTWEEVKTLSGLRTLYDNRAGAYGNPGNIPTFVFGGLANVFNEDGSFLQVTAWIEASIDGGKTWVRAYEEAQAFVVAIVYSKVEGVFYAQATADAGIGVDYIWQLLRSVDGIAWRIVGTAPGGAPANEYVFATMTAAADPIYQDANGNNCPGGVYGYNPLKKIMMSPYPDIVASAYERRYSAPQIQIRLEDDAGHRSFTYITVPGIGDVYSVAYSGGIWQAAGTGETGTVATSTDDGETWDATYSASPSTSVAMIAIGVSL